MIDSSSTVLKGVEDDFEKLSRDFAERHSQTQHIEKQQQLEKQQQEEQNQRQQQQTLAKMQDTVRKKRRI